MANMVTEYTVAGSATEEDTAVYLEVALRVARGAGDLIKAGFAKPKGEYSRKSATDPVTETDHETEAYILRQVRSAFPTHRFIGEESAPDEKWTDDPTWIVDPIDGTANFGKRPFILILPQEGLTQPK
jgi:myo-inositol-1(or 4)-monophosphatase